MDLALDPQLVAWLALGAASASVLLLVLVVVLGLRLRVVRRAQRRAFGGVERDLLAVVGDHRDAIAGLRDDVRGLTDRTEQLRDLVRRDLSRVTMLRYDAFDDMGGALSFSAALLDEHGDGLVLSAINGRTETRTYAKVITGGTSDHSLSAEENEVIAAALAERPATPPTQRRRRRSAS